MAIQNKPMVFVQRGNLIESVHNGRAVITDKAGRIVASIGDPLQSTFARSTLKPMMATAIVNSGAADRYGITDQELAVMASSHNGEAYHLQAVTSILEKIGLETHHLKCGPHLPMKEEAAHHVIRSGPEPSSLHNNCSGKHAGMLLLAKYLEADLETYLDLDHPVQQLLRAFILEIGGVQEDTEMVTGIDGCGAPVYAFPLVHLAQTAANLPQHPAGSRVVQAMGAFPDYVGGADRIETALMKVTHSRIIAKSGAEGLFWLLDRERQLGLALKIEDGNKRAIPPAVIELLVQLDWLTKEELHKLSSFYQPVVTNWSGTAVGVMTAQFRLLFS